MNATELFHADGKSAGIFYCGVCRIVAKTSASAESCCQPYKCDLCGKETARYYTRCSACSALERDKLEAERFEKAEKVTTWDGALYADGFGWNDGYSANMEELLEYCANEGVEPPPYAWACRSQSFVKAEPDDIAERISENAYDEWGGDIAGWDELKAAIAVFNEANKGEKAWHVEHKIAVLIPRPEKTEEQE